MLLCYMYLYIRRNLPTWCKCTGDDYNTEWTKFNLFCDYNINMKHKIPLFCSNTQMAV